MTTRVPVSMLFDSPKARGAKGDGVTDDSAALNAMIAAAGVLAADRDDGTIAVDLQGLTYGIASPLRMDQVSNVKLCNGGLVCLPTWNGSFWAIDVTASSAAPVFDLHLEDLTIDCNYVCRGALGATAARNCHASRVTAIHFTEYGFRVFGASPATIDFVACRAQKFYFSDPGYPDFYQRTGVGFSIESSDCIVTDCLANFCAIPLYINTAGCNINGGHYFNGDAEPEQRVVATYGTNGAGKLRIVTTAAHGYVNGELILLPFLSEIQALQSGYSDIPWPATVINATTVDFLGVTASGTFSGASDKLTMRWADEPKAVFVASGTSGLNMVGTQFDSSKVVIEGGVEDLSMVGCHWAMGNSFNRAQLEFVTTRTAEDWAGIAVVNNRFANGGDYRLFAKDSGTLAAVEKLLFFGNIRKNGDLVPARGTVPIPAGSVSRPGLMLSEPTLTAGILTLDFGTGIYGAGTNTVGLAANGKQRVFATATATIVGDPGEAAAQFLDIDAGASREAVLSFDSASVARWQFRRTTSGNLQLQSREDDGTFRNNILIFDRTTGGTTIRRAILQPAASVTPAANGDVEFQLTSNTQLTIKARGSDGTVRSVNLTLA